MRQDDDNNKACFPRTRGWVEQKAMIYDRDIYSRYLANEVVVFHSGWWRRLGLGGAQAGADIFRHGSGIHSLSTRARSAVWPVFTYVMSRC